MSDPTAPQRVFRRQGLGRGLDALLSATPREDGDDPLLIGVDPAEVQPNPEQPRREFEEGSLQSLAESLRLHGLLHPIVVQREGTGYRLVAGERRLRAAQLAGLTRIPAILRPAAESGRQALELALTENLQRSDLNPLEEAAAYSRLADAFGLSHDAIALRLGRARPTVSNSIRLLNLPPRVQAAVAAGRVSGGHARAILGLTDPLDQELLAARVEAEGLSVRQTEREVQAHHAGRAAQRRAAAAGPSGPAPDDTALQRGFEQLLGLPVQLRRRRRGGGQLVVDFADAEDLDGLYRRLGGGDL